MSALEHYSESRFSCLPRFLVDENLAGMTRWLRFFGFDTVVALGLDDRTVADRARKESRILVTRDRELAQDASDHSVVWIRSDNLKDQLKAVIGYADIPEDLNWFSRCTNCNLELRELSRASVLSDERIPESVRKETEERSRCWTCDSCGRAYWKGSHYDRALGFLTEIQTEIQQTRLKR